MLWNPFQYVCIYLLFCVILIFFNVFFSGRLFLYRNTRCKTHQWHIFMTIRKLTPFSKRIEKGRINIADIEKRIRSAPIANYHLITTNNKWNIPELLSQKRQNKLSVTHLQGINRSSDELPSVSCRLNKFLATGLQYFSIRFS